MRKTVQVFTVRNHVTNLKDLEFTLRRCKAIGYDSIQMGRPSFMTAKDFKALLDEVGMGEPSSGGDYLRMMKDPDAIREYIEDAHTLGVNYIEIGTMPREFRESAYGFQTYAENLNKIAAELKKEGMRLLYHPHALEFYSLGGGRKGMDILFEETDPEGVNFVLDTHWMTCGGVSPVEWIHKVKGRMSIIHFKDYAIIGGAEDHIERVCKQFAEVGEGNIPWESVIAACRDIGVEYAVVEQDICKGSPFDSLEISFRNMVKLGV